jgi:hypothetical protein
MLAVTRCLCCGRTEPFSAFIMSMAMSNTGGILAAGAADGRLWIGFKGEKASNSRRGPKKKLKKWEGLDKDEALLIEVAEGPIVAM